MCASCSSVEFYQSIYNSARVRADADKYRSSRQTSSRSPSVHICIGTESSCFLLASHMYIHHHSYFSCQPSSHSIVSQCHHRQSIMKRTPSLSTHVLLLLLPQPLPCPQLQQLLQLQLRQLQLLQLNYHNYNYSYNYYNYN